MINQGRSSERTFQNLSDYKPKYRPVEVTESIESTARRIALDLGASEQIYDGNASAYAHERMLPRTEALMIDKWNAEGGITGMTLVLRGQGEIQRRLKLVLENFHIAAPNVKINDAELYMIVEDTIDSLASFRQIFGKMDSHLVN
jgi:hypothetical protein